MIGVFGVAGLSFGLWARLIAPSSEAERIPERIVREAFDIESERSEEPVVQTEARRVGLLRTLDFHGEGERDLVEFLTSRRVAGLGACYTDRGPHSLRLRLGNPVELIEADEDARACLDPLVRVWPWPDEARGVITIELETAILL